MNANQVAAEVHLTVAELQALLAKAPQHAADFARLLQTGKLQSVTLHLNLEGATVPDSGEAVIVADCRLVVNSYPTDAPTMMAQGGPDREA